MSANSSIQWTDKTWNPIRGCSVVSPGCVNCYAMKQAHRFSGEGKPFEGLTKQTKAGPQWTGVVRPIESALLEPLSWRKPQRVFVNSMSDLFHEDVPDAFIDKVFAVMALADRHTFQVLTKRPQRMREYFDKLEFEPERIQDAAVEVGDSPCAAGAVEDRDWPLPNVWLGVSCENQTYADERIPLLLQTPAAVRFISAEPLIGPVTFRWAKWDDNAPNARREQPNIRPVIREGRVIAGHINELDGLRMLDWVIVGGESGPGARPFDLAWARSIVQQCNAAGVACFVKQVGSNAQDADGAMHGRYAAGGIKHDFPKLIDRKGGNPDEWPADLRVREFPTVPT